MKESIFYGKRMFPGLTGDLISDSAIRECLHSTVKTPFLANEAAGKVLTMLTQVEIY
jgi:hypothetical protein